METSRSMIPCFPAHGSSNGIQHLGWTPVGSSSVFQAFPWLWRGPQCLKVSTGCSELDWNFQVFSHLNDPKLLCLRAVLLFKHTLEIPIPAPLESILFLQELSSPRRSCWCNSCLVLGQMTCTRSNRS